MRILIATVPAAGHFNPLTGPAVRLAELGHDVRWYAGPAYAARVKRLGLEVIPYEEATEITGDNVNALFPERPKLRGAKAIEFDADVFFARPAHAQFRDIRNARERFPFDALLIDGAFYAGYLVAKRLDVPVFVMGSIAAPSLRGRNAVTPFFGLRPPRTFLGRMVNRAARAMLVSGSRKGVETFNGYLAEEGLPALAVEDYFDCTQQPDVARRVFNVGLPELDFPDAYVPPNAEWVGALLPHRTAAAAPLHPRVIERSGRVVVVSQGTVDNHDPQKLMIPAIEAFMGGDRLLVVVTGGVGTDELRARYQHDNLLIEDFVDFDLLFPHTELYVTNGGLGGVLLALSHGVPLLVAGTREGKGDINVRLAYRGLAVDLRSEHPSARAIARGTQRVLSDSDMRVRVAAVKTALAAYDSVGIIERGLLDSLATADPLTE
ncbi:UDP:flavonoid glycosyltransferase YjiC (YdhE family) [Agromyces ramosus]|uniref:UDP:flavonoid glycosyltransferase YjiC (YdhE family) n=1 Tax=Agromyces ramosus TaxID=33879 RepID=A0A4Q7MJA8_9MICO|nr:glycosyltransferase [Agromyces ramosus]RZS66629.1 UDP:flavonoid glycosyltransferase YjiC (YdhE family) [Agromyces ramosus]